MQCLHLQAECREDFAEPWAAALQRNGLTYAVDGWSIGKQHCDQRIILELTVAPLWTLAAFALAIVFAFQNGVAFSLCFLGTCCIPCFAVGGIKWGVARGDGRQKIGVPVVGAVLLCIAYWLSTKVEVQLAGYVVNGLTLNLMAGLVGLTIPLKYAEPAVG